MRFPARFSALACLFVASTLFDHAAATTSGSYGGVCVYNNAWFRMRYRVINLRNGLASNWTSEYAAWGDEWANKCTIPGALDLSMGHLQNGDTMVMESDAQLGKTLNSTVIFTFNDSTADVMTYKCTGTTLNYACNPGTGPGGSLKNATKAVGDFAKGFAEGLAEALGFDKCISDLESTYKDVTSIATYLKAGINLKQSESILQSFRFAGTLLKDFAVAIKDCVSSAKSLSSKIEDVAGILTGNVALLIKTVVTDAIRVYNDRTEITAESKAVTAAWDNSDYETSGEAMGKICGILINDIGRYSTVVN